MLFPPNTLSRFRPASGSRLARPITGGFWLPGPIGSVPDSAGQSTPAVLNGGVSFIDGPFGQPALHFNGSTAYVDCGLNGATTFNWSNTSSIIAKTFVAWVRIPVAGGGPIFAKGSNLTDSGWNLSVTSTNIQVGFVALSNARFTATVAVSTGVWHQVAVTWTGWPGITGGLAAVYLDGALVGTSTSTGGIQNAIDAFNLWIGQAQYVAGTAGASSQWFTGDIDHWFYDQRVYAADEIAALYRRPFRLFQSAAYDSYLLFANFLSSGVAGTGTVATIQSDPLSGNVSGVTATGSAGSIHFPSVTTILFAGQEDLSFIGINAAITTGSSNAIVINSTQSSGQFRSEYARCSINIQSAAAFASVAANTALIRTGQAFSATSFWTSGRIWANVGSVPSFGFPFMRWVDSNGVVRLLILTASNSGSILGIYKQNAAGTQTQLGANTSSGVSAAPAVPDKIDVYINYTGATFILFINGTRIFSYGGDLTTDGNMSIAYVDYGMAVGSSNVFTADNHWSECIVSTSDTRQMSLLTQMPTNPGNTSTFTSGSASNVSAASVSQTSPDYSSSANQLQQYQVDPSQSLADTDASFASVTLLVHADGANGSTNFYDVSTGNVSLAPTTTTVSNSSPKFGNGAASFAATSSRIATSNLTAFQFGSGQFTVEAWGNLPAFSSSTFYIILGNYLGSSNLGWEFGFDNTGRLAFYYSTTGSDNLNVGATYTPSLNTWIHFAVDRDASNAVRVYANGVVIAGPTTVSATLFASTNAWNIGNDGNHTRGFVGQLDEIRVTKGLARYGGTFTPSSSPFASFSPGSAVVSVVQHAQCTVSPSGPQHFEFNVRSGGIDYFTADLAPSTGWTLVSNNWDTNPSTNNAWQTSELDASSSFNLGYKSTT